MTVKTNFFKKSDIVLLYIPSIDLIYQSKSFHFRSFDEFRGHLASEHSDKKTSICDICGEYFDNDDTVMIHKSTTHPNARFPTPRKREKTLQEIKSVVCDLCGKSIKRGNLREHKNKVHAPDSPQECPQCGKMFRAPYLLKCHMTNMHTEYPCRICGLMLIAKKHSRHYQQYHVKSENRKYHCDHCGKGFTNGQALGDHVNIHTGKRPYVCSYCGRDFASSGNHRMHVRTAHLGHKRK